MAKKTSNQSALQEKAPAMQTATEKKTADVHFPKKVVGRPRRRGREVIPEVAPERSKTDRTPKKAVGPPPKRKQEAITDVTPEKPKAAGPRKRPKLTKGAIVNRAPTQKLNVYVCGEVSAGELGLGPDVKKVKRPRLNTNLLPDSVGVVQIATGGMHALALTHDNKILSWGVNDIGALGRNTDWEGRLVDIADIDADSDDSDAEMNPLESTPTAISEEHFPQNTVFTQVAASDSASFAVTDDGRVYGWGTFRNNDGKSAFMFDKRGKLVKMQRTPVLLPTLKHITQIACGADHVLALDKSGRIHAWGNGQQCQLGRRVVERTQTGTITPSGVSVPNKAIAVGCGSYHSFAIDRDGGLWAWGLNSYGETGIPVRQGEESRTVYPPQRVGNITGKKVKTVQGGAHHSVAVTTDGDCLVWGRTDGGQCGINVHSLADENVVKDSQGKIRILSIPTAVPKMKATMAAAGSDHTIAVTTDGKAYSWGFNATFQLGQGGNNDDPGDIEIATLIDNTALRNAKVNWAGAGGQYSIITAPADA
ncbi:RCC1/BLIP-II [Lindgomyces ingoldianus]|uniref:RCC1/BLIP-II n=1 Tax=Lindgomyces ingoldianus TaxID=673940 RepID=A0ACB6QLT5_9PLEO|nr:RCC1/BLIP-II [Lindgomyces ingoldianus]KAF2467485.1 RCC1/BLIP-II [Lindgomyces ingoldianus]